MKNIIYILSLLTLDCSSLKSYTINRANDFLDIFILGVEKRVYGGGLYFLRFHYTKNGVGLGLKNGNFVFYKLGDAENPIYIYDQVEGKWSKHFFGEFAFYYYFEPISKHERNGFSSKFLEYFKFIRKFSCDEIILIYKNYKFDCSINSIYTVDRFEISLGLYLGIRIGFNFFQTFDFLVGIFGFDPMNDDYDKNGNLPIKKETNGKILTDEELKKIHEEIEKDLKEQENKEKK